MTTTMQTGDRVAEILDAACRVVVRDGAHGLRMASVAVEAGVSKALVHYYFSTRRELLRSAFAWSDERWQKAVDAEVGECATGAEGVERALLMSMASKRPFRDQRALSNEVWSSLRLDDDLRPLVETSYRAWLGRLTRLLEEGRRDRSVPQAVDPATSAQRLAALGDGMESMLYLGVLKRAAAQKLVREGVRRELAP